MPRSTVTKRLRAVLAEKFQSREFSKSGLARAVGRNPSWVSMLLAGQRTIRLDELDPTAHYFRISIGELLGAPQAGELSGDEQHLIGAFRALTPAVREHFLALVDAATDTPGERETGEEGRHQPRAVPAALAVGQARDAMSALTELRTVISRVSERLGFDEPPPARVPGTPLMYRRRRPPAKKTRP